MIQRVSPIVRQIPNLQTPAQNADSVALLEKYLREYQNKLTASTQAILNATVNEVKNVIASIRYTESQRFSTSPRLMQQINSNPREVGIVRTWDITSGGLYALKDAPIMNQSISPITWHNPATGRVYLGEIPYSALQEFGVSCRAPIYDRTRDGHVYSPRHGLYLPTWTMEQWA